MELVVLACSFFASLLTVVVFGALALVVLSRNLNEAHRKLMARDLPELARAEQPQQQQEFPAEMKQQAPPEAHRFDPVANWYGEGSVNSQW